MVVPRKWQIVSGGVVAAVTLGTGAAIAQSQTEPVEAMPKLEDVVDVTMVTTPTLPEPASFDPSADQLALVADETPFSVLSADEPTMSQPSPSEPTASEPSVSEPSVSEPSVSEPSVSEPSVSEPSVSEPSVSEPSVSVPSAESDD